MQSIAVTCLGYYLSNVNSFIKCEASSYWNRIQKLSYKQIEFNFCFQGTVVLIYSTHCSYVNRAFHYFQLKQLLTSKNTKLFSGWKLINLLKWIGSSNWKAINLVSVNIHRIIIKKSYPDSFQGELNDKRPTWGSSAWSLFWIQWINIITDMNWTITTGKVKTTSEKQLLIRNNQVVNDWIKLRTII